MKDLKGKVAAITGASSGIGRALALELAARGCDLALSSNSNQKALAETAELAQHKGVKVTHEKVDVSQRPQVESWAERVVAGHGRVNLIVNNAGVGFTGTVSGSTYADYEWVMGINYWGVVYGTKAFLPHLIAAGAGHVVNVASMAGLIGMPGMSAYNASKFAVRGFTESLREELDLARNGVSATCVIPGGIKTNILAATRMSDSIAGVTGVDAEASRKKFEILFMTGADHAARAIVRGVRRNARRVLIGPDVWTMDKLQRLLPGAYQSVVVAGMGWMNR